MPDATYFSAWRSAAGRVLCDNVRHRVDAGINQGLNGLADAGFDLDQNDRLVYSSKDSDKPVVYDTIGWAGKSWRPKTLTDAKVDEGGISITIKGPASECGRGFDATDTYSVEKGMRRKGLLSFKKVPAQVYTHVFKNHSDGMNLRQEASVFEDGSVKFRERIWAGNWTGAAWAAVSMGGLVIAAAGVAIGADTYGLVGALAGAPLALGGLLTAFRAGIPGAATSKEYLKRFPMETLALKTRHTWD